MTTRAKTKAKAKPPTRRAPPRQTARPNPAVSPTADEIEPVEAVESPAVEAPPADDIEEVEEAEERPWRDLKTDGPFNPRTERFLSHPPVELLIGGAVVIGRWGTHNTDSGGRTYAWIGPNQKRLCAYDEPEGWREIVAA